MIALLRATVLALLMTLAWPWAASATTTPAPISAAAAYVYDAPHYGQPRTDAVTERGPPHMTSDAISDDAVDLRSRGTSVRADGPTVRACTSYTTPTTLAQAAGGTTTTGRQVVVDDGVPSSFQRWQVAARTGTTGADDVLNGVRLRAQLTGEEIAGGHAFGKHGASSQESRHEASSPRTSRTS
jgi:hypothetical protein